MDTAGMSRKEVYEYYTQEHVTEAILRAARGREAAGAFRDGFDQRPNILQYASDIAQMAMKGVTSFHLSVERWTSPMQLSSDGGYDELRSGWDMVFDIDSELEIEDAKIAVSLLTAELEKYGIRNYNVKFSGSRGFHVMLPWEMFPEELDFRLLRKMYPKVPRIIAGFLREQIREPLAKRLAKRHGASKITKRGKMDPFMSVNVEKDWGNRHMFRAPFALNEKTWLASVVVEDINKFSLDDARPEKVKECKDFFCAEPEEAELLLIEAMDWNALREKPRKKAKKKKIREYNQKVPEEAFPPCMKNILSGLEDGKKRSLFSLINFLRNMNWNWNDIEERLKKWNRKNMPPLPENTIITQIRYHSRREKVPPANCFNDLYYMSFGVCQPDPTCKKMNADKTNNPVSYPLYAGHVRRKQRGFSCDICNEEFRTQRAMRAHRTRVHFAGAGEL